MAVKFFLIFIVLCLGLAGCSSSGTRRAPVSDLTSPANKNSYSKKKLAVYKKQPKLITSARDLDTYIVKKGDTLYSIAWDLSTDVKTLAAHNNLKDPYTIYEGQILNPKEKKSSQDKKRIVKNKLSSQKVLKKSPMASLGKQKVNKGVVLNQTKAYSATKVDKKVVPKKQVTPKNIPTKKMPVQEALPKKVLVEKVQGWRWPAKGKVIESFSVSQSGMKGISIANQRGTAVYATADGEVVYAGNGLRGYGNLIIIKHNHDYLSAYAHNDRLLVAEKEQIKKGQKIAIMGDTGTDQVQLHFEIRYRGKSVDPLRYLGKR